MNWCISPKSRWLSALVTVAVVVVGLVGIDATQANAAPVPLAHESADGILIVLAQPMPARLSVGSNSAGNYIAYNHTDQIAIKNAGTAAVTAAICIDGNANIAGYSCVKSYAGA